MQVNDTRQIRLGATRSGLCTIAFLVCVLAGLAGAQAPSESVIQAEIEKQEKAVTEGAAAVANLLASYEARLKADANDHTTRFYYANLLGLAGRDEVLEQLNRLLDRAPNFVPALQRRAIYFRDGKNYERARDELVRALEIDPSHIASNITLADLYLKHLDRPRDAEPLLRRVLQQRPNSRSANYRLGKLMYDRGREHDDKLRAAPAQAAYREAIKYLDLVVKADPLAADRTMALTFFWLGHGHYYMNNKVEAYDNFRLAARLLPPSPERERTMENIAAIAVELGRDPLWDSMSAGVERQLKEEDSETRYQGALTLCQYYLKTGSEEAMKMMLELIHRPHPDLPVRVLVSRHLGGAPNLSEAQARSIGQTLSSLVSNPDEDKYVRASAAYGLAALGWSDAISVLTGSLDTDDSYLFGQVLDALETLAETQGPSLTVVPNGNRGEQFNQRMKVLSAWQQWLENDGK